MLFASLSRYETRIHSVEQMRPSFHSLRPFPEASSSWHCTNAILKVSSHDDTKFASQTHASSPYIVYTNALLAMLNARETIKDRTDRAHVTGNRQGGMNLVRFPERAGSRDETNSADKCYLGPGDISMDVSAISVTEAV